MRHETRRGIRSAQAGLLINTVLVFVKLAAGVAGHTYALIADAVESTADIFSSLVVWGGLEMAARDPDEHYPYGYGKAEPRAGAGGGRIGRGAPRGMRSGAGGEFGPADPQPRNSVYRIQT